MRVTKDDPCTQELRQFLGEHFMLTRDDLRLTQMEFASELNMDRRSYLDIEHRKALSCALTLLIFLCYYCKDPMELLDGCRDILDKYLTPRYRRQ